MRAQQSAGRGIAKLAAEATRGYRRDDGYRGEKPGYATTPKFPITFRGTRTEYRQARPGLRTRSTYGLGLGAGLARPVPTRRAARGRGPRDGSAAPVVRRGTSAPRPGSGPRREGRPPRAHNRGGPGSNMYTLVHIHIRRGPTGCRGLDRSASAVETSRRPSVRIADLAAFSGRGLSAARPASGDCRLVIG